MSLTPSVSICVPTYNQTVYLNILLTSISIQTFTDYEVIVSDDSTTEDVKHLIDSFSFGEKLKYYRNNPSLGSPANWNAAIQKAKGEYIKIMHHDDAFKTDTALAEMISFASNSNYDYIFTDSSVENVADPAKNRIHSIHKYDKLVSKPYRLFFGNSIGSPSALLIQKKLADQIEYDPQFIWLVDMEYYIRLLQASTKTAVINKPLVLTHDAAAHQLTSKILLNFDLQVKEQAMLYNYFVPGAPPVPTFFMQVFLARLLFKGQVKNREVTRIFTKVPASVKIYFALVKYKPLYFAYSIFIRALDVVRKVLFS